MSKLTTLAAIGAATVVLSSVGNAQTLQNDYDFNWAPMANAPQVGLPGALIFGTALFGTPHNPTTGDAIRRCYSVDITQGGRNESGNYETTWFTFAQGFGAANPIPGVDVGLLSVQSATDSDLGGDACLSPWFSSVGNTGGHNVSAITIPGLQAGTAGAAYPSVWQSVFQWLGTTSQFAGIPGANVIGVDAAGLPLLANVIYEIQGPINGGAGNSQYYLGTTDDSNGTGAASSIPGRGTGGVTNGNSAWGSSLFGTTADVSGATSHSRYFGFDPAFGLTATTPWWGAGPGTAEINGFVAFATPFLWAENNGSIGGGGADWNIASGTPSAVQVWLKDITSGAQGTADVLWKTGGGGAAGAAFDPALLLNYGFFFWSATPAVSMQQLPMSWDDLGGFAPPKAGSYLLSTAVSRNSDLAGGGVLTQSLPANFDSLTSAMLGLPGLTNGTTFTGADSVWYDAGPAGLQAIWEGMFDPVESGISKLTVAGGAAFPVAPAPDPSFGGLNIGVGAITIQVRVGGPSGVTVDVAEIASALTLTLQ
ncbi:MAG: hypothetical protein P1V81_09270 [Planctomycetota bacterium]|nr:hypothetical protein [Planctomycetota bacterium]